MSEENGTIHPAWLRVTHWINVLAVLAMVFSGWRIYDASPFLHFTIAPDLTLGGWLGGAIKWHFAVMWVLFINGLVYLGWNIATGRLARKFFPISPRALVNDIGAALRGHLEHDDLRVYNSVQRLAYILIVLDLILLVISGLVLWKSVQFSTLRELLGGYEAARRIHFGAMSFLVAFVIVHVVMVAIVPRTFVAMVRGR